jgi:Zn-dependent protease
MLDPDFLIAGLLCAAVAGYLLFVNRPHQRYAGRFFLDVPIEEAWELMSLTPGHAKKWLPGSYTTEWLDESKGDIVCRYESGDEAYIRILRQEAPSYEETVATYRWKGTAQYGDRMICKVDLNAVEGGTNVDLTYIVERARLFNGFLRRVGYPTLVSTVGKLVRGHIARERAKNGESHTASGQAKPARSSTASVNLVRQLVLAALSFAAMIYLLGFAQGLAAMATLIVHEYGHVFALRRHGHDARFYLIPFFGGIAMGSRTYLSDAEASEVLLMGPLFGFLPAIVLAVAFWISPSETLLFTGLLSLLINGFNLLPAPPLDGGRVVQVLMKPLGDKAWFAISGLLILMGAGIALQMGSKAFLVMMILAALLWSVAPKRSQRERPLTMTQGLLVMLAYGVLIAAHVALGVWYDGFLDGDLLKGILRL